MNPQLITLLIALIQAYLQPLFINRTNAPVYPIAHIQVPGPQSKHSSCNANQSVNRNAFLNCPQEGPHRSKVAIRIIFWAPHMPFFLIAFRSMRTARGTKQPCHLHEPPTALTDSPDRPALLVHTSETIRNIPSDHTQSLVHSSFQLKRSIIQHNECSLISFAPRPTRVALRLAQITRLLLRLVASGLTPIGLNSPSKHLFVGVQEVLGQKVQYFQADAAVGDPSRGHDFREAGAYFVVKGIEALGCERPVLSHFCTP
jgi:hypothetical protein